MNRDLKILHDSRASIAGMADFIIAAELQNFSRAAKKYGGTQATFSGHVRQLERALGGVPLFDRTKRSVRLNPKGKAFLDGVRPIIKPLAKALSSTGAPDHAEAFNIGFAPSFAGPILDKAIKLFESHNPQIDVIRQDLSSAECVQAIMAGKLQVGFMVSPNKQSMRRLEFQKIADYNRCCAVPSSHTLAKRRFVTPDDLKDEKFIGFTKKDFPEYGPRIRALFEQHGVVIQIKLVHRDITSLIGAVESGDGIAIVASTALMRSGANVRLVPLRTEFNTITVGIVFSKPITKLVQSFADAARQASASR